MKPLKVGMLIGLICGALLTGCASSSVAPLPNPPEVSVLPTTTSIPDFSQTNLVAVGGTTTTVPISLKGGRASLKGRVLENGNPVEGATVRIDRYVGDKSAGIDLKTNAEGVYGIDGLEGGRFRVRAYLPPTLTMVEGQLFFLKADENKTLDLNLTKYESSLNVSANIAPKPPILGQKANIVVQLTTKGVDSSGVVRAIGAPGLQVGLVTAGGRTITGSTVMTTDSAGKAQWTVVCASLTNQGLSLTLPNGTTSNLNLAECELPPTTTLAIEELSPSTTTE